MTRATIQTLHQRIRENEAAIGQPFAEQAALDEARSRRAALDATIREQAQKDEEARRNRTARAAAGASKVSRDDRDALLGRLHSAMSTMIQHTAREDAAPSLPPTQTEAQGATTSAEADATEGVENAASLPTHHAEARKPEPHAIAHQTSILRHRWHPPMSPAVDQDPYDAHTVHGAFCKDCNYVGPWHGHEQGALEDEFDHAFPGWRELLPVVAAMEYQEIQNTKAHEQWKGSVIGLYPAGWVESGGPVLTARNRGATRWHDDRYLGGNYNVCGVQRAIDLHAPPRHKRRTRLVAASYQPREPLPPVSPDGPVGELTDQDTAAALAGIFTPGKLIGLGTGLSDRSTLKVWLKARGQDSRDEHVGPRPAAPGQPATFDTVAETREGLAVVVLTDTERREGLIPWRQAAEYFRPTLTPEASARLAELYGEFQRLYADPQREIEPTLAALHALRANAATIHSAAAAAIRTSPIPLLRKSTAQTAIDAEKVVPLATVIAADHLPEVSELAPPDLPGIEPVEGPTPELGASEQESDEPTTDMDEPQEPDYETIYAEEFAQESASQTTQLVSSSLTEAVEPSTIEPGRSAIDGQTHREPETTAATTAPTARRQPAPQPSTAPTHRSPRRPTAKERSEMFEQAIDLALQGFAVFPLKPGTKEPMFKGWERRASTDPQQIARWWNATPTANIAIACGPSNLLVIDLDKAKKPDGPRHGHETLTKLAAGRELPRTFTVASARGGHHLYFRQPDGATLTITTGSATAGLGPLVDTRGHGGYIVAPGSTFDGGTYRIERDAAVSPLPPWIADELTKRPPAQEPPPAPARSRVPVTDRRRSAYGNAALKQSVAAVARAPEGTRNDTLNRESFRLGRLVGGDVIDRTDAVAELRQAAHQAGLPPGEAANTIASGLTAGISNPRFIPDPVPRTQISHQPQEAAMTTTTEQEASTTNQPATTPGIKHANGAADAAQPETGETATDTPNKPEAAKPPQQADALSARQDTSPTADSASVALAEAVTPHEATTASETELDFDFDSIWSGVRASIERARQAIPDWTELNTPDDLKPAINEARRYLAQTPIPRSATADAPKPAPAINQNTDTVELDAEHLDERLDAVDAAYADAQATGIPVDRPEWAGIQAIHSAVHNLWDTLKAAVGTYWAELSADVRVRGPLTALATRAVRAIANLADAAATHLEQRGTQQQFGVETEGPGLREAYINARNQIRAHAATHEWQRITALWGTVSTLTRQTGDPGIRAVVARSADAISDYADALGRKTSQYGHTSATDALTTLAAAAERHAAALRAEDHRRTTDLGLHQSPSAVNSAQPLSGPPPQQGTEAQLLQARARQVAQHAQARLGQTPRKTTATPRRTQGTAHSRSQSTPMRPTQPSSPQESPKIR